MADGTTGKREIGPDDDPYEFEWPDDAKELRAAEREVARAKAEVRPAPRALTAYVLGLGTVLLFEIAIAVAYQSPAIMLSLAPVTAGAAVPALIIILAIDVATRRLRNEFATPIYPFVGAILGFAWTYTLIGFAYDQWGGVTPEIADEADSLRTLASIVMMTATATGFFVVRVATDKARAYPKPVYIGGAVIAVMVASGVANLAGLL